MGATSAGLLLYRILPGGAVEVLIAHPGGPFWARKDDAAWSVPKGEYVTGDVTPEYLKRLRGERSDEAKQQRRDGAVSIKSPHMSQSSESNCLSPELFVMPALTLRLQRR